MRCPYGRCCSCIRPRLGAARASDRRGDACVALASGALCFAGAPPTRQEQRLSALGEPLHKSDSWREGVSPSYAPSGATAMASMGAPKHLPMRSEGETPSLQRNDLIRGSLRNLCTSRFAAGWTLPRRGDPCGRPCRPSHRRTSHEHGRPQGSPLRELGLVQRFFKGPC